VFDDLDDVVHAGVVEDALGRRVAVGLLAYVVIARHEVPARRPPQPWGLTIAAGVLTVLIALTALSTTVAGSAMQPVVTAHYAAAGGAVAYYSPSTAPRF
jgi:hypothetical protein